MYVYICILNFSSYGYLYGVQYFDSYTYVCILIETNRYHSEEDCHQNLNHDFISNIISLKWKTNVETFQSILRISNVKNERTLLFIIF